MTEENNKITEKTIELNEKKAQGLLDLARLQEQANKATGEEAELLEKKIKLQKAINAGEQESFKALAESIAAIEEKIKAQDELNKTLEAATALGKSFGDSIFGLDSKLLNAVKSAGGLTEAFNAFAAGVEEASKQSSAFDVGLDNTLIGFSRLGKGTLAAVDALDSAGASFVQSTGASRDFTTAAFETRDSLGLMGISGAEAVGVMGDLYSNFSEFTELSESSQQGFIELSAQIERLGGDAAGMAQTFTKVAGMSLAETETAMREVAGAADALGIPFSQVSADLVGMGELFAKMGDSALDVFLELQAAAKATGMSVQSLYNIVGQYDTFEASSQAAGRLNMVLGGNLLDTYSLLNATEEERIELLQRAMEQSSMTFDEMDRFQKREVSDALNISMEEAAQLFGATREEVRKTAAQLMYAGMTQEELADRTRDASTAMDKFKVLMGNLAIFVGPIVEGINKMIDLLVDLTEGWGATGLAIAVVGAGIVAAFAKAGIAGFFFGIKMKAAAAVAGESGVKIAAATNSVGKAATMSAKGLLAFGAAMLMVGAGIGLAALGMSKLVAAFDGLNGGQITGAVLAIAAFSIAVVVLGQALLASAGPIATSLAAIGAGLAVVSWSMLAFGAAALMVGAGIWLAASGVANLVSSFAEMDVDKIAAIGTSMLAFSAGMVSLALAAGLGGGRMVKRIVKFINLLDTTKADSFAATLSSLAQLAGADLEGSGVPEYITAIGKALDELPDSTEKTVAFTATADSLANLMQIASAVDAEQVARIETIIGAVSNAEGAESTNQLVAAISRLVNERANNEGTTNVIELDGRVLARWLDRYDTTRFRAAIGD
jgi:hypothetical protein